MQIASVAIKGVPGFIERKLFVSEMSQPDRKERAVICGRGNGC